jgi:iron complex outermembrane receptor protein
MRIDHITLGYDFRSLVKHNLRLYATVQNPLVVTQYQGLDPEISGGIDNNFYPRARTILMGVSVQF